MKLIIDVRNGQALVYDTDDVENLKIETPADYTSGPSPDGRSTHHELTGFYHLHLHIDFKQHKQALWMPLDEALSVVGKEED